MAIEAVSKQSPKTAFSFQGAGALRSNHQRRAVTAQKLDTPPSGIYILPERKVKNTPEEGRVANARTIDDVNREFRDIENTINEKPSDPKKDSGSGKESPIGVWHKWWDIRNWKQSILERMTNSDHPLGCPSLIP